MSKKKIKSSDWKVKGSRWTPDLAWKCQVLYLICETKNNGKTERISIRDLRLRVNCALGTLNKLIVEMSLENLRSREDTRLRTLLALHRNRPAGTDRYIETEMERVDQHYFNTSALLVFRRDKDDVPVVSAVPPVVLRTGKGRRGNEAQVNEAADGLTWLLSRGRILQWQYDAGTAWRADIEAAESFRGQEIGKDAVQGGLMAGTVSDSQAAALDRLIEVREAIVFTVVGGVLGNASRLAKWSTTMTASEADTLSAGQVSSICHALEAVAWVYSVGPSGNIALRLESRMKNGSLRQRGEV